MTQRRKSSSTAKCEVLAIDGIFGAPPILPGEDALAYEVLLSRVSADVKPADFIERIWVHDVVYHTWEILRWRRIKIKFVSTKVGWRLSESHGPILREIAGPEKAKTEEESNGGIWVRWLDEDPELIARIKLLEPDNKSISFESVVTTAFVAEAHTIERIDRLIAMAESRRNAVIREIERRRAAYARSLRAEIQKVEDAEFEIIKPNARAAKVNKNAA